MKEKHYRSLDSFYKEKFGCKVVKVSVDAGFTCPNKDGSVNTGGCIFCGGATLVGDKNTDVFSQFKVTKEVLDRKWKNAKYIPFLEANTNTYGSLDKLKSVYEPLLELPDVVGLSIATRCDSISDEVYDYLENLNKRTYLTIELGLQSSFDETLEYLNRGHTKKQFEECVRELKRRGIDVVVHIINGLPGETEEMMVETARYVDSLGIDGIKFHMLYIEKGTRLASMYLEQPFELMSKDNYIRVLARQLTVLRPEVVVHRLVSDPNRSKLIEPHWLEGKFRILNEIDEYLEKNEIFQGKNYISENF